MKHHYQRSQLATLTSWAINRYVFCSILSQLCSHLTVVPSLPYFSSWKSHVEPYQVSCRSQHTLCPPSFFSHKVCCLTEQVTDRGPFVVLSPCFFYWSFCFSQSVLKRTTSFTSLKLKFFLFFFSAHACKKGAILGLLFWVPSHYPRVLTKTWGLF